MNRSELSNPPYRIVRDAEGLRISVPVKSEQFRFLLSLVWLLVWAAGETALVLFLTGRFASPGSTPTVPTSVAGLFLAAFTVAGGVLLWRWLWFIGGRETFRVVRGALLARREIFGIGRSHRFALEKIRSVKASPLKYRVIYPSWGRMFIGHDESEIVIDCAGRSVAYGKGLEEGEAGNLADLLEEEMNIPIRRQPLPQVRPAFFV